MPSSTRYIEALCTLVPLLLTPAEAALSEYQSILVSPAVHSTDTTPAWEAATEKAQNFVSQLSTDEKVGMVTGSYRTPGPACIGQIGGIPRLNFTGICYADGPAGFARSDGVSVFSSGLTTAATWDTDLMYERGVALGEEFRGKGAHVHLGYVMFL